MSRRIASCFRHHLYFADEVNVFEVFSLPCTNDRITFAHLTVCSTNRQSRVDPYIERANNLLEDLADNLMIVDLLFLHGVCLFKSFRVIFRWNWKKDIKDASNIQRL